MHSIDTKMGLRSVRKQESDSIRRHVHLANAEYIRMADQLAHVPGGANNYNYSNVDVIVNVAKRESVHAVWAVWGHASENPKLLQKNGIIFIGPPEGPMRTLGDNFASTIVAQSANVPTMPWSGSGIRMENAEHLKREGLSSSLKMDVENGVHSPPWLEEVAMEIAKRLLNRKTSRRRFDRHANNQYLDYPIFIFKVGTEMPGSLISS
ncbi:acetyl-CoA carboxylase 2-like isoform X3 [Oscarella lobularis]|uniref:acetyl-CoA carboxylase 2-like isoform X3 n=1 Tax=Oscarella lobularis TaxID=121494 RepID=UPI00331433D6